MSNDNVVDFEGPFFGYVEPTLVLDGAKEEGLVEVFVIGERNDGTIHMGFSYDLTAEALLLLERAKLRLLRQLEESVESGE